MENEQFFEDYQIGDSRKTLARTITEADIVFHAGHSGDFFPHHMDAEFCKDQIFGQRVAHGTMTFAIGIGLTAMEVNPRAVTYGYERLRFPKPVFANDTIHTVVTIESKVDDEKRPKFGKVIEVCNTFKQDGSTVMYCEHILLVEKRET